MSTTDFADAKVMTPGTAEYGDTGNNNQPMGVQVIDAISRAEIDVQIATAHRFPRSITTFKEEALFMATSDVETAESCFYKLPREGKVIEGPGVRLAEIVGSAWGNMRYGARIVSEDKDFIVAQGVAHDLEKNVASTIEVRRRIVDKKGKRYSPDMIVVTANAACSISLRNAIFKVVPRTFVNQIYEAAKQVAIGDASTLVERRTKAVQYFAKMGVMEDRLLAKLGKVGIDDINLEDLELLTGLKTAIKDGDTTVDEAFPPLEPVDQKPKTSGSDKAFGKKPDAPAPKTKPELIAAIVAKNAATYQWSDPLLLGVCGHIIGKAIEDIEALTVKELEKLHDTLTDEDKAFEAAAAYDAAAKGGTLNL